MPKFCTYLAAFIAVIVFAAAANGQSKVVDRTVAVIDDGSNAELVTYSDIMWQLALQPGAPLDQPSSEVLNQALTTVIDQRLFALEADRLPQSSPSEQEIQAKIKDTVARFRTPEEFQARLRKVGFRSVTDDAFERLIGQRVMIEKYIDFRFRSFVVVTVEEERKYFDDVYVPDYKRRFPSQILPTFESKRDEIHTSLVEERVAQRVEGFLDEEKRRIDVVIISPV